MIKLTFPHHPTEAIKQYLYYAQRDRRPVKLVVEVLVEDAPLHIKEDSLFKPGVYVRDDFELVLEGEALRVTYVDPDGKEHECEGVKRAT